MLTSDVDALDQLIADDLVFTNHFGQLLTKQLDLDIHRSGVLQFSRLEPSEQLIKLDSPLAIVSARIKVSGIYERESFSADLRYTRIWRKSEDGKWRVIIGHSSMIQK